MKIAVDARWIFKEISGVGTYTRELIRLLPKLDKSNEYTFIFNDASLLERTIEETDLKGRDNVNTLLVPYHPFSPKNQILLPFAIAKTGFSIFHSTNYMIPLPKSPPVEGKRAAIIATVHDVIPLLFRNHAPRSIKSRFFPVYRALMMLIGKMADRIITVSNASMRDLIREMRINRPEKVISIYNGVSEKFFNVPTRSYRKKKSLPNILYVGRMDPYKNIEMLIRALDLLGKQHGIHARVTIVGPYDPRYPEARKLVERMHLTDRVRWTGYMENDNLVNAYLEADILAHPSRYEGFGLPVIEAMATGLPVVCTDSGALPEITGDAAIRTAPDDTPGFAKAIAKVLSQPALAEELANAGRKQAAKFTWSKTAEMTISLYRETAERFQNK